MFCGVGGVWIMSSVVIASSSVRDPATRYSRPRTVPPRDFARNVEKEDQN